MLYEYVETSLNLQLLFGLALGLAFGAAAQISRFCLRRAVADSDGGDHSARAVWIMAFGVAVVGFALSRNFGLIDLSGHRYATTDIPLAAILMGGLAFGAGMVLTRGCASRLTVLSASGNLRAFSVMITFAVVAHAAMKGVLAPLRTALSEITVSSPLGTLADVPGLALTAGLSLIVFALYAAQDSRTKWLHLTLGGAIGLIAVGGWISTGFLLMDEFDPTPVQSIAFTQPWGDSLFWAMASTAIPAGFGVGFICGTLGGAFLSAAARGELALEGFENPHQMLRYSAGGALMGLGGVLAGGCTVGAGLGGGASLSVSALLALASIISGALLMRAVLRPKAGLTASV